MFNWFEQRRARERQMFDFMAGTHNNIHAIRRTIEGGVSELGRGLIELAKIENERLDRLKKRGETGAILEEREGSTCSTITDLQQRVARLELERPGVSSLIPTEPVQYHAHANLEKRLATLEQALWPTTVTTPNTDAKQE